MAGSIPTDPATRQEPLSTDKQGRITSQAWLAYFARIIRPAAQAALNEQTSADKLLELRAPYQGVPADERLSLGGALTRRAATPDIFPPAVPHAAPSDAFPPPAPRAPQFFDLPVSAAFRPGAQQAVWSISDTHANLTKYPPSAYPVNSLFEATDWTVTYRNTGAAWKYISGVYIDVAANRPGSLGTNDAGFLFLATDSVVLEYWDGAAWNTVFPTGQAAGSYGDSGHTVTIVVDANQRITSISQQSITLPNTGPGAGTYVTGAKLTGGGTDGSITLDAQGRVTAVTQAT